MIRQALIGGFLVLVFHPDAVADDTETEIRLDAPAPAQSRALPPVPAPVPSPAPAAAPDLAAGTAAPATPRALTMEDVSGPSMGELGIGTVHARYSLNFFGDTSLSWGRPSAPDHVLGFAFGAQDLLLKGELGNHIGTTTEIAMEPDNGGIVVDIERFAVRYQAGQFFVEAGRTHTSFGYWNNAYHHGRWLQPSIDRPRWVAFEDAQGILPVHWVGVDVGAKLKMKSSTLNLYASVGNGRGQIVDDVRNAGDYQSTKAVHVAAEILGIYWPELRAGISAIVDRIPAQGILVRPSLPDQPIDEVIGGAYIAYPSFPLVLIAESYLVVHRATIADCSRHQWMTYGGFGLLGYAFGRVTPFVEYERVASRGGVDPFFIPDAMAPDQTSFDTDKGIVGLRVDLSDWTALKAEYRYTRAADTKDIFQEGVINWSWGF